jgi:uncharacterized membrane protein YuzA (DUF378 family)
MDAPLTGLIFLAIGTLTMVGAALNWGIVTRPGKLFNRIFGDTVARIIYFVAGILLFVVGIGRLIGANWF